MSSYRDLRVWAEGVAPAEICYGVTSTFPRAEAYGMTSQVRRAAVSISANVAEGQGRENPKGFVRFLRISRGSLKELETRLMLASRVEFMPNEETDRILEECEKPGKMLRALIHSMQHKARWFEEWSKERSS
jgi:four helix bundle protein